MLAAARGRPRALAVPRRAALRGPVGRAAARRAVAPRPAPAGRAGAVAGAVAARCVVHKGAHALARPPVPTRPARDPALAQPAAQAAAQRRPLRASMLIQACAVVAGVAVRVRGPGRARRTARSDQGPVHAAGGVARAARAGRPAHAAAGGPVLLAPAPLDALCGGGVAARPARGGLLRGARAAARPRAACRARRPAARAARAGLAALPCKPVDGLPAQPGASPGAGSAAGGRRVGGGDAQRLHMRAGRAAAHALLPRAGPLPPARRLGTGAVHLVAA